LPQIVDQVGKDGVIVLNLSGRGDKDVNQVAQFLGRSI
jgi:tryptophan synthase beta chain